jgi:hypothetical protein
MADTLQRKKLARERAHLQWVNYHLALLGHEPLTNLTTDIKDGSILLLLTEHFLNQPIPKEKGKFRIHWIINIGTVLNSIQKETGSLRSINADDIVNGNEKLISNFIWDLIVRFHISSLVHQVISSSL